MTNVRSTLDGDRFPYLPAGFERGALAGVMLLARLTLGWEFLTTGWGKLHSLKSVTQFFDELKIPHAAIAAPFVATVELLCGALLLIGLASRLASIPLIVTMTVALLTAVLPKIHGVADLFGQIEFLYICLLLAVFLLGPGAISIDAVIARAVPRGVAERGAKRRGLGGHAHAT